MAATTPAQQLYEIMTEDNDGTTYNSAVDHSVTPGYYYVQPPTDENWLITRVLGGYQDTSAWRAEGYGDSVLPLTNGLVFKVWEGADSNYDSSPLLTMNPVAITSNADWGSFCYDWKPFTGGAGNDFAGVRWSLFKDAGAGKEGMVLQGALQQKFGFKVTDDLSFLVLHKFEVRGRRV